MWRQAWRYISAVLILEMGRHPGLHSDLTVSMDIGETNNKPSQKQE